MHAQLERLLDRVLAHSDRMQVAAREEAWAALAELEAERRELLADLPALVRRSTDATEGDARKLTQLIAANAEIMALVARSRDATGKELGNLRQGRAATRAYAESA
jgi:hypothetical protein